MRCEQRSDRNGLGAIFRNDALMKTVKRSDVLI
jgi:hypothetical protein